MEKVHLHATTIKLNNKEIKIITTTHILTCLSIYNTLQHQDLTKVSLRVVFSFNIRIKLLWEKNPTQTERTLSIRENYLQQGRPRVLIFDSNQSFSLSLTLLQLQQGRGWALQPQTRSWRNARAQPANQTEASGSLPRCCVGYSLGRQEDSLSRGVSTGNL